MVWNGRLSYPLRILTIRFETIKVITLTSKDNNQQFKQSFNSAMLRQLRIKLMENGGVYHLFRMLPIRTEPFRVITLTSKDKNQQFQQS